MVESNARKATAPQCPGLATEIQRDRLAQLLNSGISLHLAPAEPMVIRWMLFDDIPSVVNLERQIFPSPWHYDGFAYELLNRNYNVSLVGVIQNQVIAYSVSYLVVDELHISNIAVAPTFRRLKIGETLLWISLEIGRSADCYIAHLEVRKSNLSAISLYEKYGFQYTGFRKNYYEEEQEDALLMSLNLASENKYGLVQTK